MKVLLINAPYISIYGPIKFAAGRYFPLGIGYISAVLRNAGHRVKLFDPEAENMGWKEIQTRIREEDFQLVGITCATPNFPNAVKIARLVKEKVNVPVVLGGVHATAIPETILRHCKEIDVVVVGEGENTMAELCSAYEEKTPELSKIRGLYFRDGDTIKNSGERPLIMDMDNLPFPARDLVDISRYRPHAHNSRKKRCATILTSRGCPFRCAFCASHITMGRKYRTHSPEYVMNEIEFLIKHYGTEHIIFQDDTFTLNRRRVEQICEMILERGIKIEWFCFAQVSSVDKDLLRLMGKAGCYSIGYGVESADKEVLKHIGKPIDLERCKEIIKISNSLGLKSQAFFVFGNKGDTVDTINKTIEYAIELKPVLAFFNLMVPYPGTDVYKDFFSEDNRSTDRWGDFVAIGLNPVTGTDGLTKKDLQELMSKAYVRFYLNIPQLLLILRHIGTWHELVEYVKGCIGLFLQTLGWKRRGQNHRKDSKVV